MKEKTLSGYCCDNGYFGDGHQCQKQPGSASPNGIGIDRRKLRLSTGRPKGVRNLNAKHPSSIAKAFRRAGLDWQADFAGAIKMAGEYGLTPETKKIAEANRAWARERIAMWLKLLPYLVTTTNRLKVRKWKGKASKAAVIALNALENKPYAE